MRIATMIGDVATSLVRRPITEMYPFERREAPDRLRGLLNWNPDDCIGCGLCAMDCPASAIEMIVLDKKAKRFVLHYHSDRCTFCAQCVSSCRQGCLTMCNTVWELAATQKSNFEHHFGDEKDVEQVLVDRASRNAV